MSVRAKMTLTHTERGSHKGIMYRFNPVYEGSEKLQGISENAIFGSATPSGEFVVYGLLPVDGGLAPKDREEYYLDFIMPDEVQADDPLRLFCAMLVLTYKTDYVRPDYYQSDVRFTLLDNRGLAGGGQMSIRNPRAASFFELSDRYILDVRLARGKRSEAEIAALEEVVQTHEKYRTNWSDDAAWQREMDRLSHRLGIARGVIVE